VIEIPRALARRLRAVLRRSAVEQGPRGEWPLLLCRAGPGGLLVQAGRGGVAVCYRQPGRRPPDALAFRADVLAGFEGRSADPVNLEVAGAGRGLARWSDAGVPRALEFDAVTADSVPDLPGPPRQWTPMPAGFLAALGEAARTAARDSTRLALSRVQLRGQRGDVVATDGRQLLAWGGFPFPWAEALLVPRVPAFGGRELAGAGDVAVGRTQGHVAVRAGPWAFLLAVDRASRFPGVDHVIPRPSAAASRLRLDPADAEALLAVLPRLPGRGVPNAPVTLDLGESVAVRARAEGEERPTEFLLPRSRASGPPARVCCDRTFLRRAAALGFTELEVFSPGQSLACRDGSRVYVWMPLDPQSAVPPAPDAVRVDPADGPTPAPVPPTERSAAMPDPRPNGPEPRGSAARPAPDTPQTPDGLPDPVAEAEELRELLHQAQARVGRLLAALRHQRRQGRALQAAVASLRQLRLGP
jgi:hypothetical protein